ncbi:alcohol dehydrogenase [Bifidobacterium sp. ESL0763]|uniref:alcohol dehydrogenase n=1 Tax=Bifidobacterium sp. ESL0763 TaxID=2983227 RepID=UPI0023F642F2|nr:alcohol dehydrogenase [Bifidobacterium sp. ESL0763]MDF7664108.1 alcohol dehydrogenase [Bifidobacterium sp. ESL0763]
MNPRDAETHASTADMPLPLRRHTSVRWLACILTGLAVGMVGTLAHRMGASHDVPYGLLLALALVTVSTWLARARAGATGLALHLIASSGLAWMVAMGFGGDVLTPIGFGDGSGLPYFSEHVGYLWLFGMVIVQLVVLFLPRRWFAAGPRDGERAGDGSDNRKAAVAKDEGTKR